MEIGCLNCEKIPPGGNVFCSEACAAVYHDEHFDEFANDGEPDA